MIKYITRRIVLMGPVVFLVTVIAFALVMILPGDPALAILGDQVARDPVRYAVYRHELGLDKPLADQYLRWLGRTVRGDLGTSIRDLEPVSAAIRDRLPPTLLLGSVALVVALAVAVPTAVYFGNQTGIVDGLGRDHDRRLRDGDSRFLARDHPHLRFRRMAPLAPALGLHTCD